MTPDPHRSEAELAAAALAGDEAACAELMHRHRDAVFRLARTSSGDPDAALDITQDTFIAAFAALERYDPARPFRAWISRIAINKCHDWARRRKVRRFFTFARPLDEAQQVADPSATPEQVAIAREDMLRLMAAIADLPTALKDVLILRAIEGLSQKEVAQTLGTSEKSIETRLYRARQKLSERLRDRDGVAV